MKNLLKKNDDPYLAMLAYRSTPLENGYSPHGQKTSYYDSHNHKATGPKASQGIKTPRERRKNETATEENF